MHLSGSKILQILADRDISDYFPVLAVLELL